jgi:DNA modification methylase
MVRKLKNIKAKAHPPHYMMHKYWGRKPHNVVSDYINNYTKEGEVVLDPFMGSGVVVIEALKSSREAYGIDLNPLSIFITRNTLEPINISAFDKAYEKIHLKIYSKFKKLYQTSCPTCKSDSIFLNSVYDREKLIRIKGLCSDCGVFRKDAEESDLIILKDADSLFKKYDSEKLLNYPKDKILQYVKRSQRTHINQLFTARALIILSNIRDEILNEKSNKIRDLLMMCFTSMLPNVSKMIPGNIETVNGRSGWQISKLWVPTIHTEKNIFESFLSRYKKIRKGKLETNELIKSTKFKLFNKSSEYLKNIKTESIDYIFTDPPYGESIAYFGLSMFFNSWLPSIVDYEKEIIFDPYRGKKHDDYSVRLEKVFKELYRVLKPDKYLSFTFHNRDLIIWKGVIDSIDGAGFEIKNIAYQEQAVLSGTQGINYKNTLKGDFVYTFIKPITKKKNLIIKHKNPLELINKKLVKIFNKSEFISSDQIFEEIIPYIIKKQIYTDNEGLPINIDDVLKENYDYGPIDSTNKNFAWKNKTD